MARTLRLPEVGYKYTNIFYLIDATSSALLIGWGETLLGSELFILLVE